MSINRTKTSERILDLETRDLHWLVKHARKEIHARWQDRELLKQRVGAAMTGMANAMAGVTWALACRDSLRRSKGHTPTGGRRPQSGEMWLPREQLTALRAEIKERRWSPLGAESWVKVRDWLVVESQRHLGDAARKKRADEATANGGVVRADRFIVRLAGQEVNLNTDSSVLEQRH